MNGSGEARGVEGRGGQKRQGERGELAAAAAAACSAACSAASASAAAAASASSSAASSFAFASASAASAAAADEMMKLVQYNINPKSRSCIAILKCQSLKNCYKSFY